MKRYYFKKDSERRRVYGGLNIKASIYEVKRGAIEKVGTCSWSTVSYRGEKSEVFNALVALGKIPKKWLKSSVCAWRSAGYFSGDVENHYSIEELI